MTSLSRIVSVGMIWQVISVVISKFSNVIAMVVLGWLLSKEDFALYALAISASTVVTCLKNGGIQPILVQRGSQNYHRTYRAFARYAMTFNLSLFVILCFSSVIYSKLVNSEQVGWLIVIIGLSIPFSLLVVPYRVMLSFNHRFDAIAKIDSSSAVFKNALTIVLAISDFGVFSFVIPLALAPCVEFLVARRFEKDPFPNNKKYKKIKFLILLDRVKWILFSALCTALVLQGDYLVLGFIETKQVIGIYFFGFQLTGAVSTLVTSGMRNVLLPVFSGIKDDTSRQISIYNRIIKTLLLVMGLISFGGVCVSPAIIDFVWNSKWNEAIIVVQLMLICLIIKITTPLGRSLLEANAKWRLVGGLLIVDSIGTMLSALIGGFLGGVTSIAISVAIFRFAYGLINCLIIAKIMRSKISDIILTLIIVIFSGSLASLAFYGILSIFQSSEFLGLIVGMLIFISVYVTLLYVFKKDDVKQVFQVLGINKILRKI